MTEERGRKMTLHYEHMWDEATVDHQPTKFMPSSIFIITASLADMDGICYHKLNFKMILGLMRFAEVDRIMTPILTYSVLCYR